MNGTKEYQKMLVERIHMIHTYVKGTHALPDDIEDAVRSDKTLDPKEREGWLRLFFLTAQHWSIWEYIDQLGEKSMHKGMAFVTGAIDMEYYEPSDQSYLVGIDFELPTLRAPKGRDWRVGTFDFKGNDTDGAPLDVPWTIDQIRLLDDEDADMV